MSHLMQRRKGFTLIELLIVIAVIAILAAIAIPNLLASRKSANEASAIGSLRTINSAEATYRSRNTQYGTLTNLGSLLDYSLQNAQNATTAKSGYYFAIAANTGTQYYVTGMPASSSSGDRMFYTDESGTLFAAPTGTAPTADSSGVPPTGFTQVGN